MVELNKTNKIIKKSLILISLIISISLISIFSSAQTIDIPQTDYNSGDVVDITVACNEPSTLEVRGPDNSQIYVSGGVNSYTRNYNTASVNQDGTYTILVECVSGTTQQEFCVNSPGCVVTQNNNPPTNTGNSGGSSGGGGFCRSEWNCEPWSYCNADLEQTRVCFDVSRCNRGSRVETQPCTACEESWICREWSTCSSGLQSRECFDEHQCGTFNLQPDLQQACSSRSSGVPTSSGFTGNNQPPRSTTTQLPAGSFWGQYKYIIISGIIAIIFFVALLIYSHYHHKKKPKVAYNVSELKNWIQQESAMGTSSEDIKDILTEKTGWSKAEIEEAFTELRTTHVGQA